MKILALSGFVPEHICDTVRFTGYSGDRNISLYCGYASDYISQVLKDSSIDGAVYPKSCDSTRIISSYLKESGKFFHQIAVPSLRTDDAVNYYAHSIKEYKQAVEDHYEVQIDDVKERVELVNERNARLSEVYENISQFSYASYLRMLHDMLDMPLQVQAFDLDNLDSRDRQGDKKAFVIGSYLANIKIAEIIEDSGFTVVGDNLPESGRLVSAEPVNVNGDIYKEIAKSILSERLSPTQNDFREIVKNDMYEIKNKGAQCVIYITQKYCEPYDFLFSYYKSQMDENGIPVLHLTVNDTEDDRKVALAAEAFADTL